MRCPANSVPAGTVADYCAVHSVRKPSSSSSSSCTHHHPPTVGSDHSPADHSVRPESHLFMQELAGHLKHQKIKQTRFNSVLYVTCLANVFVERQGKCAQNKPQPLVIAFLLGNNLSARRCPLIALAHGAARATRPGGINTLLFQGHYREVDF